MPRLGRLNHFLRDAAENKDLPRSENFGYMVESFSALAPALEASGAATRHRGLARTGRALLHPGRLPALLRGMSLAFNGREL